jgi:PPOX class probable F420-dependent enzyme
MSDSTFPPDVRALLERPNPAVITSVRPDGQPVSVATWYLMDGDRVFVNMDEGRKRLEYLRQNPRVSLTVLDGDKWYRHITLHGRITLVDDSDLTDIDRISRHYTGRQYAQRDRGRVSGWLQVERWHAWDRGRPWAEEKRAA